MTAVDIRELGVSEEVFTRFRRVIQRPNGLVLFCGPGDSGKTTTFYAALNELNRPDKKIITAEDRAEYYLPGVNQVESRHHTGPDFPRLIREMWRQVPDVFAVGTVRDPETARIAVQAALGGCMVLGRLHTPDDAAGAIVRLFDMGVEPFLVAGSVTAVMAQRLVRRVCSKCIRPDDPDPGELRAAGVTAGQLANATFVRGLGCKYCHHTGYRGRSGIFELLEFDAAVREMACNRAPAREIRRQARSSGVRSLLEDGVGKAMRGMTTLEEVLRVCRHETEAGVTP
jgi:type IV pilus assembly protein PilB